MLKKLFIGIFIIGIALAVAFVILLSLGNKDLEKKIIIDAPKEVVWNEFTNLENYGAWNTFITNFDGDLKEGSIISVTIQPPNENSTDFKPTLLVVKENEELRWIGKIGGVSFLATGEHYFLLKPISDNKTEFTQGEHFEGILWPFLGGLLENTEVGFEQMNEALKKRVEESIVAKVN